MTRSLTGKVVAITGAARGIGLATARVFLAEGARVAISDVDEVALKQASEYLGPGVRADVADVTDAASLRGWLDRVEEELGPLDVMVNNAGIMPTGPLLDVTDDYARTVVDINLHGVMTGTRRALESMVPRGRGVIVTLSSTAGESVVPGLVTYNASKWGSLGFTLGARAEFADSGVDICAVLPGFVNTELIAGTQGLRGVPTVEPDEVARAIVGAVQRPRARIHVPPRLRPLIDVGRLLPEALQRLLLRATNADRVMLDDVDADARRAYHDRIGKR